jgi:hypothetical protein
MFSVFSPTSSHTSARVAEEGKGQGFLGGTKKQNDFGGSYLSSQFTMAARCSVVEARDMDMDAAGT